MSGYKCPFCGKDEFVHAGAYNLHKYHCEMKQLRMNNPKATTETKHECKYSLLNPAVAIEKQAMMKGFMEVCRECQNVR
jgi:hypothetical protein